MRKKIKQLMNKEEGFTLVELLAVIVILGIILAIAIPSVGGVINRAQDNANEAEKELAIEAARMYVIAEYDEIVAADGTVNTSVTSTDLASWGYLESKDGEAVVATTIYIYNETSSVDDNAVENLTFSTTNPSPG